MTLQNEGQTTPEEVTAFIRGLELFDHLLSQASLDQFCLLSDPRIKGLQLPLAEKTLNSILEKTSAALWALAEKGCQQSLSKALLILETLSILKQLFNQTTPSILSHSGDKVTQAFFLGVALQTVKSLNFRILKYIFEHHSALDLIGEITTRGEKALHAVFRLFDAYPSLRTVWDCSPLFELDSSKLSSKNRLVLQILRDTIVAPPEANLTADLESHQWLDKVLRVSPVWVSKQRASITREVGPLDLVLLTKVHSTTGVVCSKYLDGKAETLVAAMESDVFKHVAVIGDHGSGKMAFVDVLNSKFEGEKSIVVTLEETFDSKNLVGTYVCNETGDFEFKKGPLTVAAEQGLWLILRNVEQAPPDLLSFLLPLVKDNRLEISASFSITPKLGFRIVAICHEDTHGLTGVSPFLSELACVKLEPLEGREDFKEILSKKFQTVTSLSWMADFLLDAHSHLRHQLNSLKGQMLDHKAFSVKQLFKVFSRVDTSLQDTMDPTKPESLFLSSSLARGILADVVDVFLAHIYDRKIQETLVQSLVSEVFNPACSLNGQTQIAGDDLVDYTFEQTRDYGVTNLSYFFGRSAPVQLQAKKEEGTSNDFVYTATTLRVLEQISVALQEQESVLLVGETGTGKTTCVQELAKLRGKKLHVFNLNQNTDSSDLLGGFKPVDLKFLLKPVYELFLGSFKRLFSAEKNQKFLDVAQTCYEHNQLNEFIRCLQHGLKSMKGKKTADAESIANIARLEAMTEDLTKRAKRLESGGGFIFQFIEGTLMQSIQNGDWILLDEVNLASDSVLNRLSNIIEGEHILLNERADIVETQRHNDFRIFMCMNPPYTSAGKKSLPAALRRRLTEFYVPELEKESDLLPIIQRQAPLTMFTEDQRRHILQFYMAARKLTRGSSKGPSVGLRNLSRALKMMTKAVTLKYPVIKAVYDSLFTCFASHLPLDMQNKVQNQIFELFKITQLPSLEVVARARGDEIASKYAYVEDCIIPLGQFPPSHFKETDFVLTPTFKMLVKKLASIVAVTDYAIILEGPTSAGKTSTVQYLANVTHNKVIRINNHMHTDIQEYLGSYVPSTGAEGKLVFQEGVLVEAVRNGYWVILDELNLAPSEVLEALNRLLDDNRELHIVETQKVIKAHPNFRIFATQNPTEGYGGRKELSEAFKNRFIMIKVSDVPSEDLLEILMTKCGLPKSRASLMIKSMENLQLYRSAGSLFAGKNSMITVRDLLKWGGRVNDQVKGLTQQEIALEGYLVLGERSRSPEDKEFIKQTLEKTMGCKIDAKSYYETYFKEQGLQEVFQDTSLQLGTPKMIVTQQLTRLAVLVHKCLRNREPVLLVGETGCGKTTLCQVFANLHKQTLFSINCHQNTETSDFIGCMRTRKNLEQAQKKLEEAVQAAVPQVLPHLPEDKQHSVASISSEMSVKKQADILIKALKPIYKQNDDVKKIYIEMKKLKNDLSIVFEWHDGILVEAMQAGGLLLIDEISLANDSVLERLNSVFEAERLLILSERSSAEAIKIVAEEGFNIVATMNPSGDFGKKELSPALRNRMTEIWVESYFQQEELLSLYKQPVTHTSVSSRVDLFHIVSEIASAKLADQIGNKGVAATSLVVFNMIGFLSFVLSKRFSVLQRRALSVRDVINMVDFVKVALPLFPGERQLALCLYHSLSLVILDGLCLGIDVAGDKQKDLIYSACSAYLDDILRQFCCHDWDRRIATEGSEFVNTASEIGVLPFTIDKKESARSSLFTFQAATTRSNLERLLRAFQLQKPILIEGPPGVGKTSLIENLARLSGRKLTRVNLSEQTDMMDLLGSEYPTPASEGKDDEVQFKWCDGVLLRAIKEGHWFLIDEMNLAQQSVLEGLNAVLDHRRSVYIPELNQEYECHPDFFVFACQNPSQSSSSVGGRKTLPKSFLNRFNKIFLEELTKDDYECILRLQIDNDSELSHLNVETLLEISQKIEEQREQRFDEGAVNLRDLSRLLRLYKKFLFDTKGDRDLSLAHCEHVFAQNKRTQGSTRLRFKPNLVFQATKPTELENCHLRLDQGSLNLSQVTSLQGSHTGSLQFLVDALQANFPVLVVSNDCPRFTGDLQTLAYLSNRKVNRILLNDRSDTTQLLGCFEQTQVSVSSLAYDMISEFKANGTLLSQTLNLEHELKTASDPTSLFEKYLQLNSRDFDFSEWHRKLEVIKRQSLTTQSRFEWVDSVLVKAIEHGEWVLFENANLCNPSILDRLNSLLEEGNQTLSINEQGLIEGDQLREVRCHSNFRAIFLMNRKTLEDQGRDVSRALRNRCLSIGVDYQEKDEVNQEFARVLSEAENLSREQELKILDIYHETVKRDFYPLFQVYSSEDPTEGLALSVQLGKRLSPSKYSPCEAERKSFKYWQGYLFLLLKKFGHSKELCQSYLSDAEQFREVIDFALNSFSQSSELEWSAWWLLFKCMNVVDQIRNELRAKASRLLLTNTAQSILNNCLRVHSSEHNPKDLATKSFLLERLYHELCKKSNPACLQSQLTVYLLSQLPASLDKSSFEGLEQEFGPVVLAALTGRGEGKGNLEFVRQLSPNRLSQQDILQVEKQREAIEDEQQRPLGAVWIISLGAESPSNNNQGLQALKEHFTIICMNDDKEILKLEEVEEDTLAELTFEAAPHLVLIPKHQGIITASASSLYKCHVFFEDLRTLFSAIDQPHYASFDSHRQRQSLIDPLTKQTHCLFSNWLNLLSLEKKYNWTTQVEVATMDRILYDEHKHLNLRDLPSFFASAQGLLSLFSDHLESGDSDKLLETSVNQFVTSSQALLADPQDTLKSLEANLRAQNPKQDQVRYAKFTTLLLDCMKVVSALRVKPIIEAMLVLPHEHSRLGGAADLKKQELLNELCFTHYHLNDARGSLQAVDQKQNQLEEILAQAEQIKSLMPSQELHFLLPNLLRFTSSLEDKVREIIFDLSCAQIDIHRVGMKCQLLLQQLDSAHKNYFSRFTNVIEPLVTGVVLAVACTNIIVGCLREKNQVTRPILDIAGRTGKLQEEFVAVGKKVAQKNPDSPPVLYQNILYWLMKLQRLLSHHQGDSKVIRVHTLDYFLRSEIARKMAQEGEMDKQEAQVYNLPFKMKVQSIMDDNKAIDELTAKDKERMELEAQREIEINFPSYFDEFQTQLLDSSTGLGTKAKRESHFDHTQVEMQPHREVSTETILAELTGVTESGEDDYYTEFLRLRLELVQLCVEEERDFSGAHERTRLWMEDGISCLKTQLEQAKLKSVMNIADLVLPSTFNFYHDPIPSEARLIYQPLAKLQSRVRDILQEYESPILNDVLFLANYMMTSFNTKQTPLMKMLTGMELLLEKLDEWQSYASKKLNSCEEEMNQVKQLIIRYRKIQILSWRNLLNHRRLKMIREDYSNCIRLLHSVEKQIFDPSSYRKRAANSSKNLLKKNQEVELTLFEVVDLFIRDSSLGLFESRLEVLHLLFDSLKAKYELLLNRRPSLLRIQRYTPDQKILVCERLQKVLNILHFVLGYYSQFRDKLKRTIARLDAQAREKIRTLIDVSKWSVQKFNQVKNNIDKTHRQLNRACKQEEEILMQNIQTLVLTSSRKKYIRTDAGGDQLLSLDSEKTQLLEVSNHVSSYQVPALPAEHLKLLKQLDFFFKSQIQNRWPDGGESLDSLMEDMFERLKAVRDLNKKHFQRRAFIDLLKYMKDQGLRPNFQDKLQPYIIESKLLEQSDRGIQTKLEKYFYKAQELLIMTEVSSQVDENSDLKNTDIIRIKGFTQSLMSQILKVNQELSKISDRIGSLKEIAQSAPKLQIKDEIQITLEKRAMFKKISDRFYDLRANIKERVGALGLLEKITVGGAWQFAGSSQPLSKLALTSLRSDIKQFEDYLADVQGSSESRRIHELISKARLEISEIKGEMVLCGGEETVSEGDACSLVTKRSTLITKQIKLLYQEIYSLLKEQSSEDEKQRKESVDHSTMLSAEHQEDLRPDMTISDQHTFSKKLAEKLALSAASIESTGQKLFEMEGLEKDYTLTQGDVESMTTSLALVDRLVNSLQDMLGKQSSYLVSLSKFSYLTQRIFLYLIYQGFCGQDDQEEDQQQREEDDKYFEGDGCGMGDGQGKENVSNEIEHEEQVEGLKNYESDEEQQEQQQQEQQENPEEEEKDNDFEMKEDFEGDLEDMEEKDEEEKDKQEEDEDDALDKVDDMLDNQLWNQNMEDMEQKEDEAGENDNEQDKEEIDLGERDLDKQNQLKDQDKELTAGDNDKQEEPRKEEEEQEPDNKEDQEIERASNEEDAKSNGEESENVDIPLERDDPVEEDQQNEDQSQNADDQKDQDVGQDDFDMEDAESKTEEREDESAKSEKADDEESMQADKEEDLKPGESDDEEGDKKSEVSNKGGEDEQQVEAAEGESDSEMDEANLKQSKGEANLQDQQENKDQNKTQDAQELQTQYDVEGGDILYELAQMIQQQQKSRDEEKQRKQEKPPPVKPDETKQQIENPNMNEEAQKEEKAPEAGDNQADEYEFDDQAEQMQGRLAADKVEEQNEEIRDVTSEKGENLQEEAEKPKEDKQDDVHRTSEEVKVTDAKQASRADQEKGEQVDQPPEDEEMKNEQVDLIDNYQQFLDSKAQLESAAMDVDELNPRKEMEIQQAEGLLDSKFDYQQEKRRIAEMLETWQSNEELCQQSVDLLNRFKSETSAASASLCEQLRIVLEPQLSQQLQGDFRTGKRLNMKKVISFIASHYRNDKIWLRRTMPSKRDYKILIAIDDSLSMKEQNLGFFSLEALVTMVEGLNRLEVGKVAVARIRSSLELLSSFEDGYSSERTAFIVSQFEFSHSEKRSHDHAMANFVRDTNTLLDVQNTVSQSHGAASCPFVIVLSDGRLNKDNVRKYMREAQDKRYLYIFVILDAPKKTEKGKAQAGILGLKSAVNKVVSGSSKPQMKLVPYLQDFPFSYYIIVRDLEQLPSALSTLLVQWFEFESH